jgi:Domain of unknown function (DUF4291)
LNLLLEPYQTQLARWPQTGRSLLAQFDEHSILVYQAYRPSIGHFAAQHGYFGGEFSLSRMSWIKPNFLWMMYRCGWASKPGQEVVLAIRLKRSGFDSLLAQAVHSTYSEEIYSNEKAWKWAIEHSNVRLQWDPDHGPDGTKVERRALQLGLRGEMLVRYAREWIIEIEDISDFVKEQHQSVQAQDYAQLTLPREQIYPISDVGIARRLGIAIL